MLMYVLIHFIHIYIYTRKHTQTDVYDNLRTASDHPDSLLLFFGFGPAAPSDIGNLQGFAPDSFTHRAKSHGIRPDPLSTGSRFGPRLHLPIVPNLRTWPRSIFR